MHTARRRSILRWTLLFACAFVFLGHVCAFRAAEAHHHAGDGIRAASCDAVAPEPAQLAPGVSLSTSSVALPAPVGDLILPDQQRPAPHRPPRFLLHAALLI